MNSDDELRSFRDLVPCSLALDDHGWQLDPDRSTQHSPRYRNGGSDVIVLCHGGRGWFAPTDGPNVRGDVIDLVMRIHGVSLGGARVILRRLSGLPHLPRLPPAPVVRLREVAHDEMRMRWRGAASLRVGDAGWDYLTGSRGLPEPVVDGLADEDRLRVGVRGTVWARHSDAEGRIVGWEMRGPDFKGFAKGGHKSLFMLDEGEGTTRLAVAEAFIDAISLACLDGFRADTLYVSTGGGWGPVTQERVRALAETRQIIAATDAGRDGDRLADALHELAGPAGCLRLLPDEGFKDWNDMLRHEQRFSTPIHS